MSLKWHGDGGTRELARIAYMRADCGCAWEVIVDDRGDAVHHVQCHHGLWLDIGTLRYSRLKLYPKPQLATPARTGFGNL